MKKNYFTKTLSAILVLMMVLSVMTFLPLTASAAEYDVSIATADDLLGLQAKIDALGNDVKEVRIQMTADIDMANKAFTPINAVKSVTEGETTTTYPKSVIFHGNGKSIKNLTIGSELVPVENAALFSKVGGGSSFEDIRFEDVSVYGSKVAAVLVATAEYGDMSFENIIVGGKVVSPDGTASTLVGKVPSCDPKTEVQYKARYCVNNANLTGISTVGGLFGSLTGPISITAEYCANTGDLKATSADESTDRIGGILGHLAHGNSIVWVHQSFKYCYNTGDLISSDTAGTSYIGGITGDLRQYGKGTGHPHGDAPYGNTFEMIGCFDYDSNRAYPGGGDQLNHGGLTSMVARSETPELVYTDCYALPNGTGAYTRIAYTTKSNHVFTNVGLVTSAEDTISMSTGKTTFADMTAKLKLAIDTLTEVELPTSSFPDNKERDYTWFYKDGAAVAKGSADAPYEIANAAQWAGLSALSNGFHDKAAVGGQEKVDFNGKYFKLTDDIDLAGYEVDPIGGSNPTIVLDGNGKSIANATIKGSDAALFASLGRGSEVKDLTLKNVDVTGQANAGLIAPKTKGNITLYNVKSDADSSVIAGGGYAGGFIGTINDMDAVENLYFNAKFCVNEANVTGSDRTGGFVGEVAGSINFSVKYCVNKGTVTITGNPSWCCVAGIIGGTTRGLLDTFSYFENCYNVGKLVILSTTSPNSYIGGIIGTPRASMTNGSEMYFTNCLDYSARENSLETTRATYAISGGGDNAQLYKEYRACYGCNTADTVNAYSALAGQIKNAEFDNYSMVVFEGLEQAITNQWGMKSTMLAEMAAIDNAIATLTEMEKPVCEHAYDNACDDECNLCGEKRVPEDHVYDNDQDATCNVCGDERKIQGTTTVPNNQQPNNQQSGTENNDTTTEEKKGCGGSVNALYAVVALTAIVGFAFVAKKREEN